MKWRLCLIGLLMCMAGPLFAQRVSVGVKVGVPIWHYFELPDLHPSSRESYSFSTHRYLVGPAFEMHLAKNVSLEVDALFRRFDFLATRDLTGRFTGSFLLQTVKAEGNSWEFPVLVKVGFGQERTIFLSGGGQARVLGQFNAKGNSTRTNVITQTTTVVPFDDNDPRLFHKQVYPGIVIGAGAQVRGGRIQLVPEVRYVPWLANFADHRMHSIRFNSRQLDILIGVKF